MNIQTPQTIAKTGVYELTDRDYHSDCCVGPSISSTGIKTILGAQGPATYWKNSYLNPERAKEPEKPHFRIGKAAHMLLLEPQRVSEWVARIPANYLASNGAASTKDAKTFIDDAIMHGQVPVKPDEWNEIIAMRDALAAHPHARRALLKGRAEVSLILHDQETDVFVKSRPDFMPEDSGQYIVDYKTVADLERFDKAATVDLRYDVQAALMLWLAREVSDVEAKGVLYLVQEKKPPYTVGMLAFTIDNLSSRAILDAARLDIRRALDVFRTCLDRGDWPTGYELPREIVAPGWHQKDVEFRVEQNTREFETPYHV